MAIVDTVPLCLVHSRVSLEETALLRDMLESWRKELGGIVMVTKLLPGNGAHLLLHIFSKSGDMANADLRR
jgi:hypothetical protein